MKNIIDNCDLFISLQITNTNYLKFDKIVDLSRPSGRLKPTARSDQGGHSFHKYHHLEGQDTETFNPITLETCGTDLVQSTLVHKTTSASFQNTVDHDVKIFSIYSAGTHARTLLKKKLPKKGRKHAVDTYSAKY